MIFFALKINKKNNPSRRKMKFPLIFMQRRVIFECKAACFKRNFRTAAWRSARPRPSRSGAMRTSSPWARPCPRCAPPTPSCGRWSSATERSSASSSPSGQPRKALPMNIRIWKARTLKVNCFQLKKPTGLRFRHPRPSKSLSDVNAIVTYSHLENIV